MRAFRKLIFVFTLFLWSCDDEHPNVCACLGYDDNNHLENVICEPCDAGITESTCEQYNKENLGGLFWAYNDGEDCLIPAPPIPMESRN